MRLKSVNPFSGEINKEFDAYTFEACEEAVTRGKKVFARWKKVPVSERVKPLENLASILRARKGEFARIITREMGKPIRQANAEIEKCAVACDYYRSNSEAFLQDVIIPTGAARSFVSFEPLGVILGIEPWNFPFWQVVRWAAPTLAAGNVCILKHASNVPITALEIEKLFYEAGFPENALQSLLIGAETTERLIAREGVDGISLTGSVEAGASVAAVAGRHLRKCVLELGGSDPYMVLEDADLEKAARSAVTARMTNAGQSCISAKRIIVMESLADAFLDKFMEGLNGLKIGDPMNEATDMGPVAKQDLLETLLKQLEDAEKKGAAVYRGPVPPGQGLFFRPVVLTNVTLDMKVAREEVFGPMAVIITAKDRDEMIRIANNTEFGLGAAIWSRDVDRAEQMAKDIDAGFVAINAVVKSVTPLPFGGVKKSGFGRELSRYGLKEFVNVKSKIIGK